MHWYERVMPTIEEVSPYVMNIAKELSKLSGVRQVYAWGSFAENISNKKFAIKDIDLIVKCSFESGDLLAIDKTIYGPFNIPFDELEIEGFHPDAVSFTKKYLKYSQYNIDQWAISKDKKLLHWGPITNTVTEWKELRNNAEKIAQEKTGIKRKKLCQTSNDIRQKWLEIYDQHVQDFITGGPIGWYSSETPVEDIIDQAIKLN